MSNMNAKVGTTVGEIATWIICTLLCITDGAVTYSDMSGLLTDIPLDIPSDVSMMRLDNNDIAYVNGSRLTHCTDLITFNIRYNLLTDIPDLPDNVIQTLTILDLTSNQIASVNVTLLEKLVNLHYLILMRNQISIFPMVNLPLKSLDISSNVLAGDMDPDTLVHLPLSAMKVCCNMLEMLPSFTSIHDFVELSAYDNRIHVFPNLTSVAPTLTQILLHKNEISYIPENLLEPLTKLARLIIYENLLTELPNVAGPGDTLYYLDVSDNPGFRINSLDKLGKSVTELHVKESNLALFQPGWLSGFKTLAKLYISGSTLKRYYHFDIFLLYSFPLMKSLQSYFPTSIFREHTHETC